MELLRVKDLCLGYENEIVVNDLNFTIACGDYFCIVGENGSGKSTLVKTLLGLEKQISGEIELLNGLKRNEIGYLPQKTEVNSDFPSSVYEIVLSGFVGSMGFRPFYKKKEKEKAMEIMELLGIEDLKDKSYMKLSGGQQQRVLLARALVSSKKLLIVDEPVTGLDVNATFEMYGLIRHLNHNLGVTIVMISHDKVAVDEYANHVLTLGKEVSFR